MIVKCLGSSSKGNCYVLTHNNKHLVLEAGIKPNEVLQAINFDLENIVAVLVTHEHMDHAKYVNEWLKKGVKVILTPGTQQALKLNHFNIINIKENQLVELGIVKIKAFKTFHDVAEPIGYLIDIKGFGRVLFETDTYKSPYRFKGLRLLLKEANYSKDILLKNDSSYRDRVIGSHMELETTIKTLRQQIDQETELIILIHLSDGHSNEKKFIERVIKATGIPTIAANKGLEIEVGD